MSIFVKYFICSLCLLFFTACGNNTAVTSKTTPDKNQDNSTPTPEDDLNKLPFSLTPSVFIFPKTQTNSLSDASMMIKNNSTEQVSLTYRNLPLEIIEINTSNRSSCNAKSKFRKLNPNEACYLELVFKPNKYVSYDNVINLTFYKASDMSTKTINIRYVARSVAELGDEVISVLPEYLTFVKSLIDPMLDERVHSFIIKNKTSESYNIKTFFSINKYFSVDNNSTCFHGVLPDQECRLNISFDKNNIATIPTGTTFSYEDNISIVAVGNVTSKGLSLNRSLLGRVKNQSVIKLNKLIHEFLPTKTNNIDFDQFSLRLTSKKNITKLTADFVSSNNIIFEKSAFSADFVNCQNGIKAGESCDIPIMFKPLFADNYKAILKINADSYTDEVLLSGTGVDDKDGATSIKGLILSKDIITFKTEAGKTATDQIILTNIGDEPLALRFDHSSDIYSISGCVGSILSRGQNCLAVITFRPSAIGSFDDSLIISANGYTDTVLVNIKGIATAPNIILNLFSFSRPAIDFNTVTVGQSSTLQTLTVTANSLVDFFEFDVTDKSAFNIVSSTCDGNLNKGERCNIILTFTPNETKDYTSVLRLYKGEKIDSIILSGKGMASANPPIIQGLSISTPSLIFTDTQVNDITTAKTIYLQNISATDINLKYSTKEFGSAVVFNMTSDCTAVLKPAEKCSITVKFMPNEAKRYSDELYIESMALREVVTLSGTGVANGINYNPDTLIPNLSISKKQIDFIKTEVATKSVTEEITLTYKANAPVDLNYQVENTMPHIFQIDTKLQTCTLLFKAKSMTDQVCKLVYSFNPASGEYYEDSIIIKDISKAGNSTNVKLTGTGISFISSPNFGVVSQADDAKVQRVLFVNDTNFAYSLGQVTVTDIAKEDTTTKGINTGFTLISTACAGIKLLPGKSCESVVSFKPTIDSAVGLGYQGKLNISSTGDTHNLQLIGATKHNVLLKLVYWQGGSPTVGWGTRVTAINNKIYSIGNEYALDHKKLREYNTATNKWRIITPLGRSPYEDTEKIFPIGRDNGSPKRSTADYKYVSHAGIVASGDKFYIFGGWLNPKDSGYSGGFSSNILSYYNQADTRLNPDGTWTKLQSLPTALFPQPGRHGQSIALLNNKIYAFSGRDIGSDAKSDFTLYDIATGAWQNLTPSIATPTPTPAAFTAVLGYNGKLYVDGGYQASSDLNQFWIFDPAVLTAGAFGSWIQITTNTPIEKRFIHSMVQIKGKLYIGGGKTNNKIYVFDTNDKTDNAYGSWSVALTPLGYLSNQRESENNSVMVNVDDYIWINYVDQMWVYFP